MLSYLLFLGCLSVLLLSVHINNPLWGLVPPLSEFPLRMSLPLSDISCVNRHLPVLYASLLAGFLWRSMSAKISYFFQHMILVLCPIILLGSISRCDGLTVYPLTWWPVKPGDGCVSIAPATFLVQQIYGLLNSLYYLILSIRMDKILTKHQACTFGESLRKYVCNNLGWLIYIPNTQFHYIHLPIFSEKFLPPRQIRALVWCLIFTILRMPLLLVLPLWDYVCSLWQCCMSLYRFV